MPSWSDFEAAAPELAARVRARLDAHTHKTLATVRRDGSPRISGTETRAVNFIGNVKGRRVMITDDMISTAGSVCEAA